MDMTWISSGYVGGGDSLILNYLTKQSFVGVIML